MRNFFVGLSLPPFPNVFPFKGSEELTLEATSILKNHKELSRREKVEFKTSVAHTES